MNFEYKNTQINYMKYNKKNKETIVFLHGWGQNIEMMKPLAEPFIENYNILIIDLPGHGSSTEPTYPWTVEDFTECLKALLDSLNIKKPILVGHSFGGKISLLYASKYEVEKLVLLASPYRKEIEKLSLKTKVLKFAKKIPLLNKLESFAKKHIGSEDYRKSSELMRKILVNTVNLDITDNLKYIKCPSLLIWGTLDKAVSIEDARNLEKLIRNAGLVEYEGCSHYAYLERLDQTIRVIDSFLESR